jgi:hypothetical protein
MMSLEQFLDRMVAPGNFLAVAFKGDKGLGHRFFPRNNVADAATFARWASDIASMDVWYAVASYKTATLHTNAKSQRQFYRGERTQANAEALKSFWFDADIKRAGDGKDPSKVFADINEVVHWTKDFSRATGIPLPNVWVKSGYGVHLYWTFTDALPVAQWQPYAEALKAALVAHGAKGDIGVVADAARILRPVATFNYKDRANPAPCFSLIDGGDYTDLLPTLQAQTHYRSAPKPSAAFQKPTSMAANARAGMSARPRDFALIANNCAQVQQSLQEHGEHDGRQLWRALLTLAFFCEDARTWSHDVGHLHPTYDQAKTDAEVDLVAAEHAKKSFGAPLCATFDAERPGVCAACPHNGKITSPFQLGLVANQVNPNDLPPGYRRQGGWLEHQVDENKWSRIVQGDVGNPILEQVDNRRRLTFTFTRSDRVPIVVPVFHDEMNQRSGRELFSLKGVDLHFYNFKPFMDLIMAWIDQLLAACQIRNKPLPSFGWAMDGSTYTGFAVAGTFYGADGSETPAPGSDQQLVSRYTPDGDLADWKRAAKFVAADVPELHTAIAASFGAPLMTLAGEDGGCLAFVGPSGIGKSSAFKVGAAVWGHPKSTTIQLDDTSAFQGLMLGQIRSLPVYWDEAKIATKDQQAQLVTTLHKLTQGRDKGRLTADVKVRPAGDWATIFPLATNNSVAELVAAQDGHKSATLVRVLEIEIERKMPVNASASIIVAKLQGNFGHAGRVYASYIAQNAQRIEGMLAKAKQTVIDLTAPHEAEERFYAATSACVIVGAVLATHLGLINLDAKAITKVLCAAILRARTGREYFEPKNKVDALAKTLDDFCRDHMDAYVVTARFSRGGPQRLISQEPRAKYPAVFGQKTPAFHIAATDGEIRIDREFFHLWCARKGKPESKLLDQMVEEWGAELNRGPLGRGTAYYTPRVHFVQFSITRPELAHLLDAHPEFVATTGSASPAKKIVPLRPRSPVSGLPQVP